MRSVGVERENVTAAGLADAGADGVAVLVASAAMEMAYAVQFAERGGIVHGLLGVDNQDLEGGGERGHAALDRRQQRTQAVRLEVGGNQDAELERLLGSTGGLR